jgi:hypothetical protein
MSRMVALTASARTSKRTADQVAAQDRLQCVSILAGQQKNAAGVHRPVPTAEPPLRSICRTMEAAPPALPTSEFLETTCRLVPLGGLQTRQSHASEQPADLVLIKSQKALRGKSKVGLFVLPTTLPRQVTSAIRILYTGVNSVGAAIFS